MNVEDLRIGNLISFVTIKSRVTEIVLDDHLLYRVWGHGISANTPDLHGIPLTPEILIKSGWIKNAPDFGQCMWSKADTKFILYESILGGSFHYGHGSVELKFIHQLQNIFFAFTGTELEIDFS